MKWSNRYRSLPCGCFVESFWGRAQMAVIAAAYAAVLVVGVAFWTFCFGWVAGVW